jgi:hypothetical protein
MPFTASADEVFYRVINALEWAGVFYPHLFFLFKFFYLNVINNYLFIYLLVHIIFSLFNYIIFLFKLNFFKL